MDSNDPALSAPLRKLNPAACLAYRITLGIHEAPGPLVLTDARAHYDVGDLAACGKLQPQGGPYRMTSSEPLPLARLDDSTYRGTVYLDQLLDADYHGRGTCHWELTQVRANFRASGDATGSVYVPFLEAGQIIAQQAQTQYFWRGTYGNPEFDDYPCFGESDRTRIRHPDEELFTITLHAEQVPR